ncbi:MAG: hypothetical protein HN658_10195 [Rhodospirillales bacterium]|jgi:hypothetical protein|nr:hypothetical protein [Rhodospirillales bacterium]MBT4007183.1 hypothetical protein [Rhodospirillales bacterium]MBT5076818.1 hypothetical protein [Rhodospirillales bacterium]MBT5113516.1 hypothetical protein [Rhodospirillales bacterium]MBT5673814.1 hypothetical protein [Rhodospirillales bacterium]
MKISTIVFTSALTIGLATGFTALPMSSASAEKVKGKVTGVKREGRTVMMGGKKISISGSRTNVCIKGACDEDRAKIKVGMKCKANAAMRKGKLEAKKISCK